MKRYPRQTPSSPRGAGGAPGLPELLLVLVLLVVLVPATVARAQAPRCAALTGARRALAQKLLASQHPYACCDESIADCLKAQRVCKLARRLADNICRRVAAGQDEATIVRLLAQRARSMAPGLGHAVRIDLAGWPAVGTASAKVTVVEYACARCPFCAKITPALHASIARGALRGKVRLVFKPFPIRNHKGSKEAGLGFVAAARLNAFWTFALYAYEHFDAFAPDKQKAWARAAGLDAERFGALLGDAETRKRLVAAKKEGLRHKVAATPTFFIDGRRYVGELELAELLDVLAEAAER